MTGNNGFFNTIGDFFGLNPAEQTTTSSEPNALLKKFIDQKIKAKENTKVTEPPAEPKSEYLNADEWVKKTLKTINRKSRSNDDVSQVREFKTYEYGGIGDETWSQKYTIGDGSCLVHSFLQSLSPTYRKCDDETKRQLARQFRMYMFNQTKKEIYREKDLS